MKLAALFLLPAIVVVSPLCAQSAPSKQPLPETAALRQATKVCREIYGEEYAGCKTDGEKQKLAVKLLAKARQSDGDRSTQFVLLRLARDIAAQAHDGPTALNAVDAMDEVFAVDAVEMKSAVLTKMASAANLPSRHKFVAQQLLKLIARTVADDNYAAAATLGELAVAEADQSHDHRLLSQVQECVDETTAAATTYEQVKAARRVLEKTPRDPAANLVVGKYLCFIKNDWEHGVPMLWRGNDETLKAAAKQEISGAASTVEQVALGDTWWGMAENEQGMTRRQMQRRAGYWYQGAVRGLSGVEADKVARRLKAIAALAAADTAARTFSRTATIGGSGGQCFEDIPWGQCRLIGFNVTTSAASGAPPPDVTITSVQPIYSVGGDSLATKIYGKASEATFRVVAKPGYAVGGMVSEVGDHLGGFQVIFLRVREGRLDRTDFYASDWLGGRRGMPEIRLGCDGKLVVGVFGGCGRDLKRLGLVQVE